MLTAIIATPASANWRVAVDEYALYARAVATVVSLVFGVSHNLPAFVISKVCYFVWANDRAKPNACAVCAVWLGYHPICKS